MLWVSMSVMILRMLVFKIDIMLKVVSSIMDGMMIMESY